MRLDDLVARSVAGLVAASLRHARLVVALDASAAANILQALPVTHVQQVTAALSTLDAPEHAELQEAVQSFLEELELGDVGDYRAANEAA